MCGTQRDQTNRQNRPTEQADPNRREKRRGLRRKEQKGVVEPVRKQYFAFVTKQQLVMQNERAKHKLKPLKKLVEK